MRHVTSFPHEFRHVENVFIPMSDGAQLAARLWLPVDAERRPVPAVFEYIPYRKRDVTRGRDAISHPYLAGHGYASVRVDMRGSGDSDGVLTDEYRPQEQQDAVEVIAWLADQEWCDGNVGMFGISWGGFNSLQVAARRPPELKAIISASASDDLYVDNMHYMGGCLLSDNLSEATVMVGFNSLPPDPEIVGARWYDMWLERLKGSGLWLETWLEHQRRDDYWKPASVCEDYDAIDCPVLAVGGWADGYTDAIFRLLEHLSVPRKGLIGPWGHKYPHMGKPGPAVGFLQEAVRWWDQWLKGADTGIMDEPMIRAWMQDSVPPSTSYEQRPGRWVGEPAWPSPNIEEHSLGLAPHHLFWDDEPPTASHDEPLTVQSSLSVGMFAGKWASYSAPPDLPYDQREEDGAALVFESRPLDEPVEIFGIPRVVLDLAVNRPVAMVAVRLSDVAENGEATRVTYGVLNLTHRDGHEDPQRLEPQKRYRVEVGLKGVAQRFPAGHRLRLSLSTSYWPLAWPPPEPVTMTVFPDDCEVVLPIRPERPEDDAALSTFGPPEGAPPLQTTTLEPSEHHWRLIRDLATDESTLEIVNDQGRFRIEETGTEVRRATNEWYRFRANDVTSVSGETRTERVLQRGDWGVRVTSRTVLTSTESAFVLNAQLDAFDLDPDRGDPRVFSQNWHRTIPRDHV